MTKIDPSQEHLETLDLSKRVTEWLEETERLVEKSRQDRQEWESKRAHYQRRRYAQEWRNPSVPWPGSSSVVMPLIDTKIDELKPKYLAMVTQANPPVTVQASDRASIAKIPSVELFFEWLLSWGSPNFVEEQFYGIDDVLEMGRGIWKTLWCYKTQQTPETLVRDRLPKRLRDIVVVAGGAKEADTMQALAQEMGVPDQKFLSLGEFDRIRGDVERVVRLEFQLDEDEPADEAAFTKIMGWFRGGAKEPLTVGKRDVVVNAPAAVAVSPLDLVVPAQTTNIQDAEHITHVMRFNGEAEFRMAARDRNWNRSAVEVVLDKARDKYKGQSRHGGSMPKSGEYAQDQADRWGLQAAWTGEIEVHETCGWYSTNKYGAMEKVVALYSPEALDTPLRVYRYDRRSGKWPYATTTFELCKKNWYDPRGIPEIVDDLEEEITFQHRAKLNRMMIANCPSFAYRPRTLNPSGFRWLPGQFYPVREPSRDLREIVIQNLDISFEREEQILRTWAESRVGSSDFGLGSELSRFAEPRTATEIGAIQSRSASAISMRGLLHQLALRQIFTEFFHLWHTHGPEEVYVQVTGGDEPILMTKEELQGNFVFQPTGSIGDEDPRLRAQKSLARIQVLSAIVEKGLQGDRYEIDLGEAIVEWLEQDDLRAARRIVRRRTDDEVQQIQAERQRQAQLQQQVLSNSASTPEELMEFIGTQAKKLPFGKAQQVQTT